MVLSVIHGHGYGHGLYPGPQNYSRSHYVIGAINNNNYRKTNRQQQQQQ